MNIRGKIYSIVAVMALTALTIGTISFYTLSIYDARVDRLENSANRALNGEALNKLVTAVVMDLRGTYAATRRGKAVCGWCARIAGQDEHAA